MRMHCSYGLASQVLMGFAFRRQLYGTSGVGCTSGLQSGVQGRLAYLEADCSFPDVQPVGNVLSRPLQLLGGNDRLVSSLSTARGGSVQPSFGALADQIALELAQCAKYVKDESPPRCGGVNGFRQRTEPYTTRF